ncbi:MAG: helix-turn-helix domain-containing protein [Clostridiales bacterium]|nr:helix-turn-helix domain-containing protein [Clostridiales bacterium]
MKLSMWTILSYFEHHGYRAVAEIKKGDPCISDFCISVEKEQKAFPESDILNICSGSGLGLDAAVVLVYNEDRILLPDASIFDACMELSSAMSYYNRWENKLLRTLVEQRPLQDILDIAHDVFERPMFIKSNSNYALAISRGYGAQTHPDWIRLEESVSTKQSDMDAIKTLTMDNDFRKAFQDVSPTIRYSPLYKSNVLHANVWLESERICEIVVLENNVPFNPGEPYLLEELVHVTANYVSANRILYNSQDGVPSMILDMVKGKTIKQNNIDHLYPVLGWDKQDSLLVIAISPYMNLESPAIHVLQENLIQELKHSFVFIHEKKIVCISNLTREGGEDVLIARLENKITTEGFHCGISYEFAGLEHVLVYYQQALSVLKVAESANVLCMRMAETALSVIHNSVSSVEFADSMIHPDILRLRKKDKVHNMQYVKTLYAYLLHGGNYTDTANYLGVHRNSVIYRMSNIETIMQSDLKDMNNRKQLLLSFLLFYGDEDR